MTKSSKITIAHHVGLGQGARWGVEYTRTSLNV